MNYIANYNEIKGITGISKSYFKSSFCSKSKVESSFDKLISSIKSKYILISYNNEGLIDMNNFQKFCVKYGNLKIFIKPYKKFKAQKRNY